MALARSMNRHLSPAPCCGPLLLSAREYPTTFTVSEVVVALSVVIEHKGI